LTDYVAYFSTDLHVIFLNETRIKPNEFHLFNLPGYTSYHVSRRKLGGGVSIFIKNTFSDSEMVEAFECENANILLVKLKYLNTHIAGSYKPPDTNLNVFLPRLDGIVEKYQNLFIFGDLNVNILDESNNNVKNY
jgi:exonuclease III